MDLRAYFLNSISCQYVNSAVLDDSPSAAAAADGEDLILAVAGADYPFPQDFVGLGEGIEP